MTVRELNRDQLDELKWHYFYSDDFDDKNIRNAEGLPILLAGDIPDSIIFAVYDGTDFVNDDFSCSAANEEPKKLCVCSRCLMAIESHEGQQITRKIYLDDDDARACDWCEEAHTDILYEIL